MALARALSGGRVYTPQLVVNGRSETVGSDEEEVLRLMREGLDREPAAALHARLEAEVTFAIEPDWRRPDLGVVAFLQDPKTLTIHGAARATLEVIQ